jgi:hypothetical protein
MASSDRITTGMKCLIEALQKLSLVTDLTGIQEIVRDAARRIAGADGATFILRDADRCHYVDEDAIEPLWKGQRFPLSACVSGWSMLHRQTAIIPDIYADPRVPHDAYRPTFVKSMLMAPIRTLDPLGAIGVYWAAPHSPTPGEAELLESLANATSQAIDRVRLLTENRQADRVFSAFARALPGTVLDGRYRIEEELDAGGFGAIFRGRHLALDCPIAIKVFRPIAGNDSASALSRFQKEVRAASSIDHPNAVRVLDSGVSADGVAYLVMELLQGRSLQQELAAQGALPLKRATAIAARVADVLAAAHRLGLLHRDIKPDNVFLHRSATGEVVKVVDFGIAKYFGGDHDTRAEHLTHTGEYVGTPSFAAPERLTRGADDGRSDIFSLGAVLYEMICGTSPWTRKQLFEMASGDGLDHRPRPMHDSQRNVPEELERLVERMLKWNPAGRPTAAEAAQELDRLAQCLDDRRFTGAADLACAGEGTQRSLDSRVMAGFRNCGASGGAFKVLRNATSAA